MTISYTCIRGNTSKATLPSVEDWGTNMNILKDPPKAVFARRIDKVNARGEVNEMLYHSGDRFDENLLVYARGINPMIEVQYTNSNGAPSKLPYRILKDGAFRPPMWAAQNLAPLSRLPRLFTSACTNKQFDDYTKVFSCSNQKQFRMLKPEVINTPVDSHIYFNIQTPIKEPFEVKYVIQNPVHSEAFANISKKSKEMMKNQEPIQQKNMVTLKGEVNSHMTGYGKVTYLDNIHLDRKIPNSQAETNKADKNRHVFIEPENEIILENNIPNAEGNSNISSRNFHVNNSASEYKNIKRNLQVGGIEGSGYKPSLNRMDFKQTNQTVKSALQKTSMKEFLNSR